MSLKETLPQSSSITFSRDYIPPFEEHYNSPDSRIFNDISLVKTINVAKFPVYLISSRVNRMVYALKVFSTNVDKYMEFFLNETRFSCLRHPNIIKVVHYEQDKVSPLDKKSHTKTPYTIMEFAPYGDLFDFIKDYKTKIDDKLIRTFFRELIDGVEYLHIKGIAHMDLKLENLLIAEDYNLKITDFDISYIIGDEIIYSKGTKNYRAPEVSNGTCRDFWAADMYAIGIILFILKTRGVFPYLEDKMIMGYDFRDLIYSQNELFWKKHGEIIRKKSSYFDKDFKTLFNGLVRLNPKTRFKIDDVKKSKWYNGSVYSKKDFQKKCKKMFKC